MEEKSLTKERQAGRRQIVQKGNPNENQRAREKKSRKQTKNPQFKNEREESGHFRHKWEEGQKAEGPVTPSCIRLEEQKNPQNSHRGKREKGGEETAPTVSQVGTTSG